MTGDLITREQWGARFADGFRDRPMPVSEWWLHHTVTVAPDLDPPFDDDDAAVRTLERIGEQRFGGGISYTYPVTPAGRIYQGVSLHRQGAHTIGHNTAAGAFAMVGDYRRRVPTSMMREAIARRMVIDCRNGHATRYTLNGGHRQASGNVGTTECPGDAGALAVPIINARARALWNAGYPNRPATGDDTMTIRPEDVDAIADAAAHVILTRPLGTADGKPYTVGQALRQLRSDAAAARRDAAAALTVLPNLAAALEAVSPGDAVVEEVRSALESLVVRLEVTDPTAETAVDGVDPLES